MKKIRLTICILIIAVLFCYGCNVKPAVENIPEEEIAETYIPPLPPLPEFEVFPISEEDKEVAVPVLMYHDFIYGSTPESDYAVTVENFEKQLVALKQQGYTTISPHQLKAFCEKKSGLPEKPIIITIDDGYRSNLELAAPILKKHGMNATVFMIGITIGEKINPHTNKPLDPPRFSWEQAQEWETDGTIVFQSHTYDMHQSSNGDENIRNSVSQLKNESDEQYTEALIDDVVSFKCLYEQYMRRELCSLSFPLGIYTDDAVNAWKRAGVNIFFTSEYGCSKVKPSESFDALFMGRWNIKNEITGEELIENLEVLKNK